ncbi:MAG: hypothetical protein EXQ70_03420 [Solirubrobacterales bacterium]|nr:hypothetical protein [Solirubrobacterales bacterium]
MTPSWGDSGFSLEPKSREERRPTWPRVVGLAAILVVAFVVAKGCQDLEVQVTQEEAVASANEQVDFTPTYTQVRLLRQGINRKAFWFVSLSRPIGFQGDRPDLFAALAVVEIDAKTGEVTSNKEQSAKETAKAVAEAARRDVDAAVRQRLREVGDQAP